MNGEPATDNNAGPKHVGVCPAQRKRQFRTRGKAIRSPQPVGQPRGVYLCKHCGFWHTTTHPRKAPTWTSS